MKKLEKQLAERDKKKEMKRNRIFLVSGVILTDMQMCLLCPLIVPNKFA